MLRLTVGAILSLLGVGLATFLAACTTHEDAMKSWVGYPVSSLMKQWGPPDKQAKLDDGSTVMEWTSGRTTVLPVIQGTTGVANIQALGTTNYSALSAGAVSQFPHTCSSRFVVGSDGLVQSYSHSGCD